MAIKKGNKFANSIAGTAGADTLYGYEGNDTLQGLGGHDKLIGGIGNDRLFGGTGNDKLYGDTGNDTLFGEAGNDSLTGGDGNDTLNGDANNDTLAGGNGNDTLNGGANHDRISGGTGTDTAVIGAASTAVTITRSGSSFIISSAATGTDTVLSDVENVRFTDGTLSLTAKTFNLTNGADSGAAFKGGLNNDTFNARIDTQIPLQTTYSGGDALNGGGGTDQLVLQISGTGAGATAPPISLTAIETVTILNQEQNGGVTNLDASLWNGVTRIMAENGITNATTVIENVNALVGIELKANSSGLVVDYNSAVLGGLADAQTLILSQSVDGFFSLAGNVAETLNVVSRAGPNTLAIDNGNSHSTIVISGDQSLELSLGGMNTVLAINAGGMSGGGAFIDDIGGSDITITGSGFDDGFVFSTGDLTSADVINGGGGTDIIGFGQNAAITDAALANVTSVETVAVGNGASLSVELGAQAQEAGIQTIEAYEEDTALNVNVITGFAGALSINLDATDGDPLPVDNSGHADTINAALLAGKLTVTALAGSLDGSDTINASSTNTTDELKLIADNGTALLNTVTGIDTITVVAGTGAGVGNDISIELLNDNIVEAGKTLTVSAVALTNSNAQFFFNGENEFDGSFNVTGGNGADQIRGGQGNDVVDGGAGDDRIGGGGGNDNLKGGLGNDSFYTFSSELTLADTIDGGSGTDTLFISDNGAVLDAQFTKVTNVDIIASDDNGLTLTLGALAKAAGVTTVDGTGNDGDSHNIDVTVGFSGPLTVTFGNGLSDRVVSASASALTVGVLTSELGANDTLTGGTGTSDALRITADGGGADLSNVTNFETITVLANAGNSALGASLSMADANVALAKTLAVNASALTNSAATFFFDGSAETGATSAYNVTGGSGNDMLIGGTGNDTLTGGNGNDTIIGGAGNDSASGGSGNDVFETVIANLTSADTIDGGAQTTEDTLKIMSAGTLTDAQFTNVTNVERLDLTDAGGAVTATLAAEAFNGGSGLKRVVSSASSDSITIAAAYTGAMTVILNGGSDTADASGSTAALTVEAGAIQIDGDILKGGTGAGDVLKITADNGTAAMTNVTGFETITIVAVADADITLTMADGNVDAAKVMTVNAAALTDADAVFSFIGSSETNGGYNITSGAGSDNIATGNGNDVVAGGAGNDTISGGNGVDSLTGGEGNDSITGGAGNDTIVGGAGSDTVNSGLGADTIDLGAEAGTADQDVLVFNVPGGISGVATVANFDAAAGTTFEDRLTVLFTDAADGGEIRASGAVPPLNDAKLVILDANATGYFAAFDAVTAADSLQTGSAIGESYVFVWNDTSGRIHVSYATVDNAGDSAVDSPTDLAILTGVSFANLNLSDFII